MIQLGAPGVYIVEAPSGLRPITAVATSIAAFVDFFPEGPTDRAVQIFGPTDYQRNFGGLDTRSEASYAISQFFLNGGSSAWVVRAVDASARKAFAVAASAVTAGTALFTATAASEGAWGNGVRFSVTPNANGTFNVNVTRYDGASGSARPVGTETFTALSETAGASNYYVDEINGNSGLVQLSNVAAGKPVVNGTLSDDLGSMVTPVTTGAIGGLTSPLTLTAVITPSTGTASQTRTATISWPATSPPQDIRTLRGMIESALRSAQTSPPGGEPAYDAAFAGMTVDFIPAPSGTVGGRFLVRSNKRAKTYDPAETVEIAGSSAGALKFATAQANVQEYVLGFTGTTVAALTGTANSDGLDGNSASDDKPGATELINAMHLLDKVDLFNMLSIPRMGSAGEENGLSDPEVTALVSAALTYCDQRRALLFVDIPKNIDTPQKVQDWLDTNDNFRDNNSVIYFPRVQIPDPVNNFRLRSVAPSGTMAGIYARTDGLRGVWKAPAGIEAVLRGVSQLDYKMNDAENGVLNPLGINCLRVFPIYGEIAWGARTLEGADVIGSEWKYVPIRRLALMIEESLFRGTKWVVFEPNDEPLWAKIRQNVGAFMLGLFRQGAFQGGTPSQAFFVKCDAETTTANDRQLGIVNIQVGFAPLKPAEFVVITISQIPDVT